MRLLLTDDKNLPITTLPSLTVTISLVNVTVGSSPIPRSAPVLNSTGGFTFNINATTGTFTVTGLSVDKLGTFRLRAAVTGSYVNASGTTVLINMVAESNTFDVVNGPPTRMLFITQPSNGTSGETLPTQPYIAILDAGALSHRS